MPRTGPALICPAVARRPCVTTVTPVMCYVVWHLYRSTAFKASAVPYGGSVLVGGVAVSRSAVVLLMGVGRV